MEDPVLSATTEEISAAESRLVRWKQRLSALRDLLDTAGKRSVLIAGRLARSMRQFILELNERPRSRFLVLIWSFFIIFSGISVLSASNPFRLLVPGLVFPIPVKDGRSMVEIFGVSQATFEIIPVKRKMLISGGIEQDVRRLIFLIGRPVDLHEGSEISFIDLEPLPRLGLAVRRIWHYPVEGGGELIIDFREETLREELAKFLKNRNAAKRTEKMKYLDSFFNSLTRSVFHNQRKISRIQYLLDGEKRNLAGMDFLLSRIQERSAYQGVREQTAVPDFYRQLTGARQAASGLHPGGSGRGELF